MLTLLLMSMLTLAINIQQVEASYSVNNTIKISKSRERNITMSFPTPQVEKVGRYDWLRIENCSYFTEPGHPMLPFRSLVVKLPEKSMITGVKVEVKEALLPGTFSILPTPPPTIVGSPSLEKISEDPVVYESEDLFPSGWYVCREAHGIDAETNTRVKYLIVDLFPLRFLPAKNKVLRANSISITVDYVETEISTSITTVKNLIITSSTLEAYAIKLARWKNNTGISSKVVNTTWIYAHYSGVDNQEKIRNCIKNFVATYGVIYVTIFGDADQVPVRYAYVPDGVDTYTPTDLYYADLDGTWDDNHDGLYADQRYDYVDGIPDVYIGRIPPSLVEYAQTAVDKIKGYQQQFDPSESWTRRVVLAAGTGSGDGFSNPFGTAFPFLKNYTANICIGKDVVKLYESYGNLSTGSMATETNKGALFVNFAGHGDPSRWLFYWVIPGLWSNGFGISDVQSLTNAFKLPVVTTMACNTARFDDTDCIGEGFVLEPDGGSIAYFGATRIAWGYPNDWVTEGLMGEMDWRIYEALYEGYTKLGQMWGKSISSYIENHPLDIMFYDNGDPIGYLNEKTVMEFILLGDPTLRIYNPNYPETLNVREDYPTIQAAINAAYDGDAIFVHNGTYYENVVVNKSVSLIGENREATIIDGNGAGNVMELTANNITITSLTIRNSSTASGLNRGIYLLSSNSNVSGNMIINNQIGISILGSSNDIIGNNITNNTYGIRLDYSLGNMIYHNNFMDNSHQVYSTGSMNAWDEGYPSGGNYWSDYAGVDEKSGLNQAILGSDGIADTPYIIDANNRDHYPLIKPYSGSHDIGITSIATSKTVVGQGCNLNITIKILNYGINTETFNVTLYANTTIIQTITNIVLTSRNSTIITFTWNTSGFAKGNYTIWAYAWPVPGETNTADNTCVDGWVRVSMIGDVSGEPHGTGWGVINIYDVVAVTSRYALKAGDPNWNPNADLSGEPHSKGWGTINIYDVVAVCARYGQKDP